MMKSRILHKKNQKSRACKVPGGIDRMATHTDGYKTTEKWSHMTSTWGCLHFHTRHRSETRNHLFRQKVINGHKGTTYWRSWCDFSAGYMLESNICPSPNCIKVNLCAGRLLLMLEVEKSECCTESKSYRGRVACGTPWRTNLLKILTKLRKFLGNLENC